MRLAAALACSLACAAAAADAPQWPPSDEVATHMRELQAVITSTDASATERATARSELSKLLKSPNASGATRDEKPARPVRAAIEPLGPVVRPVTGVKIPQPDVASVEVTEPSRMAPPRIAITPQTGRAIVPSTGAAVDPRTGHLLHETPNGYIDPRTGAFTPK